MKPFIMVFAHAQVLERFLTGEQFEVHRALGFHATLSFFAGKDRFGLHPAGADRGWVALVRRALKRLNVPDDAVDRIALHQADGAGEASRPHDGRNDGRGDGRSDGRSDDRGDDRAAARLAALG